MSDISRKTRAVSAPTLRFVLVWGAVLASGCFVYHSEKNRPGDVDITEPPDELEDPQRVQPDHPGVSYVTTQLAPTVEFGTHYDAAVGRNWTTRRTGVELTGGYGTASYPTAGTLGATSYPTRPYMLAVGWVPHSTTENIDHRLYAEFRTPLFTSEEHIGAARLSAGWSVQPRPLRHGPQLTAILVELLYARANWDIGDGWAITGGVRIPFGFTWVQSL